MISLREINLRDKNLFFKYLGDQAVKDSYNNLPENLTEEDVENQIDKIKNNCRVILLDGTFIGLIYFWSKGNYLEIGFWIAENYRRRSYGSFAVNIFLRTLKKGTLVKSNPINEISKKFLERNNFEKSDKGFYLLKV